VSTPSVRIATRIPSSTVPSRSVQNGARTLLGRAGSGMTGSQQLLSSLLPPPTTT
jgi:hypothetical protein